jgi:hypothetical protein
MTIRAKKIATIFLEKLGLVVSETQSSAERWCGKNKRYYFCCETSKENPKIYIQISVFEESKKDIYDR